MKPSTFSIEHAEDIEESLSDFDLNSSGKVRALVRGSSAR